MANALSKLEQHREFIAAERRKNTTYRRLVELLAERGVDATVSTIHNFVKVRSKPRRKVITMYEPDASGAIPTLSPAAERAVPAQGGTAEPNTPAVSAQIEAIRRLKQAKPQRQRPAKGLPSFSEDGPLERLSDEEAQRLRDEL